MLENAAANAKFNGITEAEYWAKVDPLLEEYAIAHDTLDVYNDMQQAARDAAVMVGTGDFKGAIIELEKLERVLDKGPEAWAKEASKVWDD